MEREYIKKLLRRYSAAFVKAAWLEGFAIFALAARLDRYTGGVRHMSFAVIIVNLTAVTLWARPIFFWVFRLLLDYIRGDTVQTYLQGVKTVDTIYSEDGDGRYGKNIFVCYQHEHPKWLQSLEALFADQGICYVDEQLCGARNFEKIIFNVQKGSHLYHMTRTKYARVVLAITDDCAPDKSWSYEKISCGEKADSAVAAQRTMADTERCKATANAAALSDEEDRFRKQVVTNRCADTFLSRGASVELQIYLAVFALMVLAMLFISCLEIRHIVVDILHGQKLDVATLPLLLGGALSIFLYRTLGWMYGWLTFTDNEVIWRCPFRKMRRFSRQECRYASIRYRTDAKVPDVVVLSVRPIPGGDEGIPDNAEVIFAFATGKLCRVLDEWLPPTPQKQEFLRQISKAKRGSGR